MEKQLIYNSVTCLECGETLVSNYTHDFKTCSCPQQTSVDGGLSYGRYSGKDLSKVQTNYLYDDAPFEVIREYLMRGSRGKNGDEELKYVKLKNIDDAWLQAIIVYENEYRPQNRMLKYYLAEKEFRKNLLV